MADIVSLIAKHGEGGHDYPLRMAQLAQADQTRQQTENQAQRHAQETEMRGLDIEQTRKQMARQKELEDISRSSDSSEEWIKNLNEGGFHAEAQQAENLSLNIRKKTLEIQSDKREQAQEEAYFLAQILKPVTNLDEQTKALELFDSRFPNSDVDEMIDRSVYDENLIAMYRFSALASGDWIKFQKQESIDKRAAENLAARLKALKLKEESQILKEKGSLTKRTDSLRKEYNKAASPTVENISQLDKATRLLASGTGLGSKLTQAILANQSGSKVRALAELVQYRPGQFGDILERLSGKMAHFIKGGYSAEETREINGIIKELKEYYKGLNAELKDYYRYMAEEGGLDSHSVAKYDSPDEIAKNRWLSQEQKIESLHKYFPKQFPREKK